MIDKPIETILRAAFEYTCDTGGRDSFIRPVPMLQHEIDELNEEFDGMIDEPLCFDMLVIPPESWNCPHCKQSLTIGNIFEE